MHRFRYHWPMMFTQIGKIRTPYRTLETVPKYIEGEGDVCEIEVFEDFSDGLKDSEQASHLIVLYWLDKADRERLEGKNPHDGKVHGVFATRSPHRPNPIAFSVVSLIERRGNILKISGITALDGTPLLDIKPYHSGSDSFPDARIEWVEKVKGFKN